MQIWFSPEFSSVLVRVKDLVLIQQSYTHQEEWFSSCQCDERLPLLELVFEALDLCLASSQLIAQSQDLKETDNAIPPPANFSQSPHRHAHGSGDLDLSFNTKKDSLLHIQRGTSRVDSLLDIQPQQSQWFADKRHHVARTILRCFRCSGSHTSNSEIPNW